jgi:alpha-L-fucosidase
MIVALALCVAGECPAQGLPPGESSREHAARMAWWREARFGLFIHWGLYAVPAGSWKGNTGYGEWIRTTARIPLREYEQFVPRFNPERFDPDAWARAAKAAGMKYIVITTKHHDGFALFNSALTDFDVMSTPFHRDIMKALADACRKEGIRICWYHSIMDWHHPDYLPRREWETDRPDSGADFRKYVAYLKGQIRELLTAYGPIGVLWFDGEWESTWNTAEGKDLYAYVRSLQPSIIVNNRVGAGRSGMEGFTKGGEFAGDFGTPEQEIPATGLPGVDWETCMTMNEHWGYNSHDAAWKSTTDLIRMLADIASKGGNFLLNVGPTAEGMFPPEAMERLQGIGRWMEVNGEGIHGTSASPFPALAWGRCTQKGIEGGTRLYLHVFTWPADGILRLPGIFNSPARAFLLADARRAPLTVRREENDLLITLPHTAPDTVNAVVALDVTGAADIAFPPEVTAPAPIFLDSTSVTVATGRKDVEARFSTDGTIPTARSPLYLRPVLLTSTATVTARLFRSGRPVSPPNAVTCTRVIPEPATDERGMIRGIAYSYYEGDWDSLPDFRSLRPLKEGTVPSVGIAHALTPDHFGFRFEGYVRVPADGVYEFSIESDDGSSLSVGESLFINNDGLHGLTGRRGVAGLKAGFHRLRIGYFEKTGSQELNLLWGRPGGPLTAVPDSALTHTVP